MNARPVFLMECPVAGFQFHDGEAHWTRIKPRDRVTLRREPGNLHDARAIAVEWQGVVLGYVPREANYTISQMLDRGTRVEGRIARLQPGGDPSKRVALELFAQVMEAPAAKAQRPEEPAAEIRSIAAPVSAMQPPRLETAPSPTPVAREHVRLLEVVVPEIARRLALPATVSIHRAARSVRLWNAIEIAALGDGSDLRARYLETQDIVPPLTADLSTPISAGAWSAAFVPALVRACNELGIPRDVLKGATGQWLHRSLRLTFRRHLDFAQLRRGMVQALGLDRLARSLANRIFDAPASASQFNWVAARSQALALAGIEHPRLLPFLRFLERDRQARSAADPLAALKALLADHGVTPAVWTRIEQWGFEAFEPYGAGEAGEADYFRTAAAICDYAILLFNVEAGDSPPRVFAQLAAHVAIHASGEPCSPVFIAYPDWFMRALLRECEDADEDDDSRLCDELMQALDWLHDARPQPDANQRKAGWPWIAAQARAYVDKRDAAQWPAPWKELDLGTCRVVAITSGAELREEARQMKNCLEGLRADCEAGRVRVFSMRDGATGKRLACFSAARMPADNGRLRWKVQQIAGKMNAAVPMALQALAIIALSRL